MQVRRLYYKQEEQDIILVDYPEDQKQRLKKFVLEDMVSSNSGFPGPVCIKQLTQNKPGYSPKYIPDYECLGIAL